MCGELCAVLEVPAGHLDPRRYTCLECLEERQAIRDERREQRPPVPYGEFPEGY